MKIVQFLKSGTFFKHLFLALLILATLIFLLINLLGFRTHHGEKIEVPSLIKIKLENADEKLSDLGLELEILDTIDYNSEFPPYSIVEHEPHAGEFVKDGRKIYVKINAGGYELITLPDLEEKTYRQIQATLRAIGLKEGEIEYVPNLAKDLVLGVKSNGKILKKGDKILKNSVIDLQLGDGKKVFVEADLEQELDSLNVIEPEIEPTTEPEVDKDLPKVE